MKEKLKQTDFFGLKVSVFTYGELVKYIYESLNSSTPKTFFGYSIGSITRLKFQPEIYRYINDSDLMVTDGRLFYLLSKMFGLPLRYDISIPYLAELVLCIGNKKKSSVMLLGSTEENNKAATKNLKLKNPNMIVYDGYDGGDFSFLEHNKIVDYVNKYKPDILLIGVSSPKKEFFVYKQKQNLKTKIIIPCGGFIDVLSGKSYRIPSLIKKTGLGWAWRTIQEPKRLLWYKIWQVYQVTTKLIPAIIINKYIKKETDFFLPSIYGIDRD